MSTFDAVRAAVGIALAEDDGSREPMAALRFVRALDRDVQIEARAAVEYVYQTGKAPPMLRVKPAQGKRPSCQRRTQRAA